MNRFQAHAQGMRQRGASFRSFHFKNPSVFIDARTKRNPAVVVINRALASDGATHLFAAQRHDRVDPGRLTGRIETEEYTGAAGDAEPQADRL